MPELTLVVGNKNYSSWSLRAWLALALAEADFEEVVIPLDRPETQEQIRRWSAAGKVPVLLHGALAVWDSLAILEYAAELYPEAGLLPADRDARALARAAMAEMHAGFAALRRDYPMDMRRQAPKTPSAAVERDIERICTLWRDCRQRSGGPFLFGEAPGAADAVYAPVASRFRTYQPPLPPDAQDYVDRVLDLPQVRRWADAAAEEPWQIADP
jgi:glutathione S-transferase